MIKELYRYWTTPCSPAVRKLGYLKESIAIEARVKRVAADWQSHQQNTRAMLLQAASRCHRFDRAVLLGAGLLFDIPLAALARQFAEVIIVDVVLSRQLRTAQRHYPNVLAVAYDITGTAARLADYRPGSGLPEIQPHLPHWCTQADLVASVNLLSQLPVIPGQWLVKKGGQSPAIDRWLTRLLQAHLEQLQQVSGQTCLVTDTEHRYLDRSGRCYQRINRLSGVRLPPADRQWSWPIAPYGEAGKNRALTAQVGAWLMARG